MPIIEPGDKSLKDLDGLHLWHGELSSCSQRVRITLEEKKLDWNSHIISIPKNEHATPEYQAIHPNGLVPAFVDNGLLLIESCDIITYLDEKYSKFSLYFIIYIPHRDDPLYAIVQHTSRYIKLEIY